MIKDRPAAYRRMTSVTTTVATTVMPTSTRASTTRRSGLRVMERAGGGRRVRPPTRGRLLVQREPEIDELLALRPQVRDRLAVDLLGDFAELGERGVGHRVHLHARGRDLLQQLVVVRLALD